MIRRVLEKFLNKHEESIEPIEQTVFDEIEEMFASFEENGVRIWLGEDLQKFAETLGNEIKTLRIEIKEECGFILPAVNIKTDEKIQENEYKISANGKILFYDFIIPTKEIAKTVKWLAESEYITGQVIRIDGGWLM